MAEDSSWNRDRQLGPSQPIRRSGDESAPNAVQVAGSACISQAPADLSALIADESKRRASAGGSTISDMPQANIAVFIFAD